jgi:hypothetical protein
MLVSVKSGMSEQALIRFELRDLKQALLSTISVHILDRCSGCRFQSFVSEDVVRHSGDNAAKIKPKRSQAAGNARCMLCRIVSLYV